MLQLANSVNESKKDLGYNSIIVYFCLWMVNESDLKGACEIVGMGMGLVLNLFFFGFGTDMVLGDTYLIP